MIMEDDDPYITENSPRREPKSKKKIIVKKMKPQNRSIESKNNQSVIASVQSDVSAVNVTQPFMCNFCKNKENIVKVDQICQISNYSSKITVDSST